MIPQDNPGEYESSVREHLSSAWTVDWYMTILNNEGFDVRTLELKGELHEIVKNLFLSLPEQELDSLLKDSPFSETQFKVEIHEKIREDLKRMGLPDSFPSDTRTKLFLHGHLRVRLEELQQQGFNSPFFQEFKRYFRTGE